MNVRWLYRVLADPERASDALIGKLADGLRRLRKAEELDDVTRRALMEASYGAFLTAIAPRLGVTPTQVWAADPRRGATADKHWLACSHVRQAAIYLAHTMVGIPQRAIARTVGLTEAAVCLACRSVEQRRDDPNFDRLLDQAAHDVTGRWTV
ncbi:hypothetical protein BA190_26770 [Labrys sp. WJW]|uniref:hypothetical protein n=1 Tax=Labrys sp. WJW TaxID=1737983 RepID=UPI0008370BF8|nr:hypothetical protein [Labrys sp. WJW]OCC01818.1 hypothetical protein BA190_26770 [Labrys sp. WJW]